MVNTPAISAPTITLPKPITVGLTGGVEAMGWRNAISVVPINNPLLYNKTTFQGCENTEFGLWLAQASSQNK